MTSPASSQNKEIDCLSPEAQRLAEARLAAKRAARAEAREIRMKELERQQKEIYQVQKKYYGLDTKWGDIEQWMEDSERYSRRFRRNPSASDEDERLSVGSRGSLRPELEYGAPYAWTNGYDGDYCGSQSLSRRSGRASMLDESSLYGARRGSACGSRAPSEYSGHLNSSSRASSRASSARASPVVEERPDKDFTEKGSRNMPSLSAATLASLGGTSSRRGSGDTSISMDTEASIREIKDSLAEVEEKYKKAMVSNAQLDNEKTNFMYQVDTLKDTLLEMEERLAESQRQYEEKSKEFEREKHAHSVLQFQFAEVKEALRQREEMLEEIRQLQQKQAGFIREISDLQETIEWKDRKIGALERQKEFFDSIRSERDELREETAKLKEELKKHGIILNSEIATNGETSDTVNDVGYQGPTKITNEELTALKSAGEGTLGKAKEVEVQKEMVQSVGEREPLQNTEQEQPKASTVKDCVDRGVSHPGENAEDQSPAEDTALSPGPLAGARCEEQVPNRDEESTAFLKNPEQTEPCEVTTKPEGRATNPPEQANFLGGLDSEVSGPATLGIKSQSENSIGNQDKENQEDLETDLEKVSFQPCSDYILGQTPGADEVNCADSRGTGGNYTENVLQAGGNAAGEQVGPAASGPLEQSEGSVSHSGRCVNDGAGPSSEGELAREVAEPEIQSSQAGEENTATNVGDNEVKDEKPIQATPETPIIQSSHQDTTGLGSTDAKHAPRHGKDPNKGKTEQQAEALDSPQKKAKNKKKKNKKKKAPAPVESCKDANEELNCQNTEVGGMEEEEQVQLTAEKPAAENPEQDIGAGSSEHVDCPEDPKTRLNGKRKQEEEGGVKPQAEKVTADRDVVMFDADMVQSLDTRAGEENEDRVMEAPSDGPTDVLDHNSLQCEDGAISPMGKKGLPRHASDACQTGSEEDHVPSQYPDQLKRAVDDHSLDNCDLSGELGGFSSESGDQTRREVGDGKNKDCTMS